MVTLEKAQGAGRIERNEMKCSKYIFINANIMFLKKKSSKVLNHVNGYIFPVEIIF